MGFTYQSETIAGGFTVAVSWTMLLLRIAQQVISYARSRRSAPQRTAKPPNIPDLVGTFFFLASTVLVTGIFGLRVDNSINAAKAGDKLFKVGDLMLPYQLLAKYNRYNAVGALLAPASLWAIKFSYISTFWGMVSYMRRGMRIFLICVTVYMVITYIVVLCVDVTWCRPLSLMWTYDGTYTECNTIAFWDVIPFNVKFAMTISTDVPILVFTLCLLHSFQHIQARERRIDTRSVLLIVVIGCMSIVSCILRYIYNHLLVTQADSPSIIQYSHSFTIWQYLEILFATFAYGLTSARQQARWLQSVLRKSWDYSLGSSVKAALALHKTDSTCTATDDRKFVDAEGRMFSSRVVISEGEKCSCTEGGSIMGAISPTKHAPHDIESSPS